MMSYMLTLLGDTPDAHAGVGGISWISIITEIGVVASIAVFLVWTTWAREQRLSKRVTTLEEFLTDKLLYVIKEDVQAKAENTQAVKELTSALKKRPCMAQEAVDEFVKRNEVAIMRLMEMQQQRDDQERQG